MQTEKHIVLIYCHMYIYHRQCHCHHYKRYHNHNVHHHHSHLDSLNAVSRPLYFHHFCKKSHLRCSRSSFVFSKYHSLAFYGASFLSSNIYMWLWFPNQHNPPLLFQSTSFPNGKSPCYCRNKLEFFSFLLLSKFHHFTMTK